jgi:membrane associated rhomboid family serine protease
LFERTPVTAVLIAINLAFFGLQYLVGHELTARLALWPVQESPYGEGSLFRPWQLLTYSVLHEGVVHLLFNMIGLYMIGPRIEMGLGSKRYAIYYVLCTIGAAVLHLSMHTYMDLPFAYGLGASGAVFGLLLAFGVAYPKEKLMLIFLPVPMPAWFFVALYALVELYFGVTQTLQGVGHFAHLGGMATGLLLISFWRLQSGPAWLNRE